MAGPRRKIVTHLDRLDTWPWYKRLGTRVRWNVARQWHQLRTQLIAGALVVGTAITSPCSAARTRSRRRSSSVTTGLGVARLLKAAKDPSPTGSTTLFAESDYGRQLGVMEDIKHDLEYARGAPASHRRGRQDVGHRAHLVLIDDLDRCEPAKAVEVLQAVNLLLNFAQLRGRAGHRRADRHRRGREALRGPARRAGASGYEYLDKIVQIPFRIPEPDRPDILTFIAGQLGDPIKPLKESEPGTQRDGATPAQSDTETTSTTTETPDEVAAGLPDATPGNDASADEPGRSEPGSFDRDRIPAAQRRLAELEQLLPRPADVAFTYAELEAFERFADHLRPNPRHLKRLVNVYRLVRSLAIARDERLVSQRPEATIRWLVMWSQWPFASLAMVDRYDALVDEHGDDLAERVAVEDPLLHLLDAVKAGLDAE